MKEITMFYLENCPYCKSARNYMNELKQENDNYNNVQIKMIEERKEKELADSYDYYYVPCYYIDGQKVCEGAVDKNDVKKVFDQACDS